VNFSEVFIYRPVMTTLLMCAFVFAGILGYATLPVSELPTVDNPTIVISAAVPGADAETMATAVATPLENAFSTIAGIDSMSSKSAEGSTQITLQFTLDRNIDGAAQDVQSAISSTLRQLPTAMPTPPTLRKVNPSDTPIFFLVLQSKTLPLSTVDQYAESLVARRLSTIDGVAQINVQGSAKYAVRIQADPDALATRGIGIDELINAINAANVNAPTGTLDYGARQASIIHAEGQLVNAAQFKQQIVAYRNGAPVRFGDVANVIDSVENNHISSEYNGQPDVLLQFLRQPGANMIKTVDAIKAALPGLQAQMPPSVTMAIEHDRSQGVRADVRDMQITLIAAAVLVVIVIFFFLRSVSATFIPSIALPISVIGTFAFMSVMGYSLDNLSLLALTLSVVFVVDDAIVMLENIVRHIEAGEAPREAALSGSREISFTIVSMTVSLAAVFIPVVFMGGIVGRMLHEMAFTIVIAILVSGLVSVTLTPMLCSRLLRASHEEHGGVQNWRIMHWSEAAFAASQRVYASTLRWTMHHPRIILGLFLGSIAATAFMFTIIPLDFLPSQDGDMVQVTTMGPTGVSYASMTEHQKTLANIAMADPNISGTSSSVYATNTGMIVLHLADHPDRRLTADEVIAELRQKMMRVPGISVFLRNPPVINIGGMQTRGGYQYTLQSLDRDALYSGAQRLVEALGHEPDFVDVSTDVDLTPSVNVSIDRDRAAALGVSPSKIEQALGAAFGGEQVSTIYTAVDQYHIILEVLPKYQTEASALSQLYLTATDGSLVPLSAVTKIAHGAMALSENHMGELPSITVSFNLANGVGLGDVVNRLESVEQQIGLPASVSGSFQGTAKAFRDATSGLGLLLLGAIAVVYIVLGILYESFIHPLTILSGLPAAATGALVTLYLFGVPLSLYAFVGIIMLIGIVKKNAIMMIDFALERQRGQNIPAIDAIQEAALVRFRPIMMTTMAALVGTLPIALGLGAGGEVRKPLGLAVVGGLLLSQLLTLYITPVIYSYLDRAGTWSMKRSKTPEPVQAE
jgi:HAE1 family hydrophobic/amphiphilic exporter-1